MERITLLDTAIASTNKGDEIIMACVEEELHDLLKRYYVMRVPTHLSAFNALECIGKLPDSASEIASSKYKFVCGTNLLSGKMLHRTNQWDIHLWNCRPIKGCILVGVGGSSDHADGYTKRLYQKVLSKQYVHSVRDQKAYDLVTSLGFKCENTGCVSMWSLTPEFCAEIPKLKQKKVIFTLTDYNKNAKADTALIETVRRNYEEVYFWIQGAHDYEYLQGLTDVSDIRVVGPDVKEYQALLRGGVEIDYVGTRLHAGIFAMRHKIRSIIIQIDARMDAMSNCIPCNCISRNRMESLDEMINSKLQTNVILNWDAIKRWKGQFYG